MLTRSARIAGCFIVMMVVVAPAAMAVAIYKDPATGALYADSAPNRVSVLPGNLEFWGRGFLQYRSELARDPQAIAIGATASDIRRPYDAFEVTRAYFGMKSQLGEWGRFEFLYDFRDQTGAAAAVSSVPTAASGYHAAIKALFVELTKPSARHRLRFGQINLPWIAHEESLWPYRVQGPVMMDREGYIFPTDRGVGLAGKFLDDQLDYDVAYVNGESWNADEVNTGKTVEARLTLRPSAIPGLTLSGFGDYRRRTSASGGVNQFAWSSREIALLAYTHGPLTVAGEYAWTREPSRADVPAANRAAIPAAIGGPIEGQGYSVFAHCKLPFDLWKGEWRVLGRWDHFDPDQQTADNGHDRAIGGLSFRPNKNLMFVASYDHTQQEPAARSSVPGTSPATVGQTAIDRDMLLFQTQVDF